MNCRYQFVANSGCYSANKRGEIFSHHSKLKIKPKKTERGYFRFNAYVDGKAVTLFVHRFVWCFFHGEIAADLHVNHKNFSKADNSLKNLELITHQENMTHARLGGRCQKPVGHARGTKNGRSLLNEKNVLAIAKRLCRGESVSALAKEFGVGQTAIYDIKSKKSWRHLWGN